MGAVGVSVLFPCIAPLDREGRGLHPALLYCDRRSLRQVAAIEARRPREDYEAITGNVLTPGNCAVTSILWLRDERPDVKHWIAPDLRKLANDHDTNAALYAYAPVEILAHFFELEPDGPLYRVVGPKPEAATRAPRKRAPGRCETFTRLERRDE